MNVIEHSKVELEPISGGKMSPKSFLDRSRNVCYKSCTRNSILCKFLKIKLFIMLVVILLIIEEIAESVGRCLNYK